MARPADWASFIKVEHTLFSLPMLFAGAWTAAGGLPGTRAIVLIALAGVGARTLAMALNRLVDREIDARNPRTASRELPSGRMRRGEGVAIALVGLAVYLSACAALPPICLWLSPIPVIVFAGYPYLKRFTPLAHYGVGTALALAPLGAHAAVTGSLADSLPALLLAAFTLLWVGGFDIIYATLDLEFDRRAGLHSLPAALGRGTALRISALSHTVAVAALAVLYFRYLGGALAAAALVLVAALLLAEQRLAANVNLAFFRINIAVGFAVLALVVLGVAGI